MRRALVIAILLLPTFALGGRYIRPPGGSVGDRIDALAAMAMPRTLSEIRTRLDSARMARAIDPGELFLCAIPGHPRFLVTKASNDSVYSFKSHADETDPVFAATNVVTGSADSSIAVTGGLRKSVAIDPGFTNTWSAIQKFTQGIVTEYRESDSVSDPPSNAELQSVFGSSLDGGYLGKLYDSTTGKKYIVGRANGVFDYVLVTTAL